MRSAMACANITGNGAKNQEINEFDNSGVATQTASSWLTRWSQWVDATLSKSPSCTENKS